MSNCWPASGSPLRVTHDNVPIGSRELSVGLGLSNSTQDGRPDLLIWPWVPWMESEP
ncbi:hypothetical protein PSAC2689_30354 [Paraburkholderia sacchari]